MLSILTNFGCHWGCSYCVYRDNKISIPKTTIGDFDFKKLENEIKNMDCDEISISGGGDPLHNWKENRWFFDNIRNLAYKYDKKLVLHTSYVDYDFNYSIYDRVVFHLTMPTQIRNIRGGELLLPNNVRVVYVVQEHYSKALINNIAKEVKDNDYIDELSFRQRIDKDGNCTYTEHEYLKGKHQQDWYYIEQADYNEYFVNDHIEKEYLNIK